MWIVRLALNRPYTFIVLALLILLLAPAVILRTPTDIFPNINIPVISVAWTYTGLDPEDIETRLTTPYEKALTTLVDNIQHIESTSYNGIARQDLSAARRQSGYGECPGSGRRAVRPAFPAPGNPTAGDHQFQRVQRAHSATRAFRKGNVRAGTQ